MSDSIEKKDSIHQKRASVGKGEIHNILSNRVTNHVTTNLDALAVADDKSRKTLERSTS